MGPAALDKAIELAAVMRSEGFFVEYDLVGRGLKAQMKYADKIGAKYVIVIGDSELETGNARLKNMATGEQIDIALDSTLCDRFSASYYETLLAADDELRGFVETLTGGGDTDK